MLLVPYLQGCLALKSVSKPHGGNFTFLFFRFFVRIFSGMERNGQLLKYYRKCLKARVLKSWERTVNEHQHETVLEWTKYFFAESESMVKDQVSCPSRWCLTWCVHVSWTKFLF